MKEENGKTGTGIEISLTKKSILGAVHKLRHHNWQKMTEGGGVGGGLGKDDR